MKKDDFKPHTRYTVTLQDDAGKPRPANLYALRLTDDSMIVRLLGDGGTLRKIAYDRVLKIVRQEPVPRLAWLSVPETLLAEAHWRERHGMEHYGSSPGCGK